MLMLEIFSPSPPFFTIDHLLCSPLPPSLSFCTTDLGVDGSFWVGIERIHSAAKAFDRELWAEQRVGSERVWEILVATGSHTVKSLAKDQRTSFFQELEERGETAILRALDTISTHIQWVLVAGGENMLKNRVLHNFSDKSGVRTILDSLSVMLFLTNSNSFAFSARKGPLLSPSWLHIRKCKQPRCQIFDILFKSPICSHPSSSYSSISVCILDCFINEAV